jgi:hypothetical protein
VLVDADADGAMDTVRSYAANGSPGAGDWHLRVELAAGGGADLALPFDPAPAGVTVLGGTYIGSVADPGPQGLRPVIFATVGSGASASIIGLFRLDGCNLVEMGDSVPVGGGVMHSEHLRCEGVAGTSLLVYVTTEFDVGAGVHEITETPFTRADNTLVAYAAPLVWTNAVLPSFELIENCGGVSLP